MATLYIVATPIGNLEDMTYRAVRILREVDIVAAEDTRISRRLLNRYEIKPPRIISCRAQNEPESAKGILKLMGEGLNVAYVSDAGTPGISDPGGRLVTAVREADYPIVPIPGPSALTALMSISGMAGKGFLFEGFLSPKAGKRQNRLNVLLDGSQPFVLYESPHRIVRLLTELNTLSPERKIFIGKEITKKFEAFSFGTSSEVLSVLKEWGNMRGEFAVVVASC